MIGFRWSIDNYEPNEETFKTYQECKDDIYDEYIYDAVISLVYDDGGCIFTIGDIVFEDGRWKIV